MSVFMVEFSVRGRGGSSFRVRRVFGSEERAQAFMAEPEVERGAPEMEEFEVE